MASKALKLPVGSWIVVALFTISGVLHLTNPSGFMFLMPPFLPEPILLIYLSGVAELASALGLLLRTNWGRYITVATLLAVWPANWWFAIEALEGEVWLAIAAFLRLPLQIPLLVWAWRNPAKANESRQSVS